MSALNRFDGQRAPLALPRGPDVRRCLTTCCSHPRVLVLGAGAGGRRAAGALPRGVRRRCSGAQSADDRSRSRIASQHFPGSPYSAPDVRVHIAEARRFVASSAERYDLIAVALLDAFGATAAGLHALSESYLYTVEASTEYLRRLAPDGLLAITRWVTLPPRDMLKLVRHGSRRAGTQRRRATGPADRADPRLATVTLLVQNGAFTDSEIAALKAFCRTRSFDLDYFPGHATGAKRTATTCSIDRGIYEGAVALLGPARERVLRRVQVRRRPGHRRPALLLPLLQVAHAARAAFAQGARRNAADRLGLSGIDSDARTGGGGRRAADSAAAALHPRHRRRIARPV